MACFLVPGGEAIVASIVKKVVKSKEDPSSDVTALANGKISWTQKLSWLTGMLWGGAILLALEHIWHGEVVFYPPFLTAMADSAETAIMLEEMATVGVSMAILVTITWLVMILVVDRIPRFRKALSREGAQK